MIETEGGGSPEEAWAAAYRQAALDCAAACEAMKQTSTLPIDAVYTRGIQTGVEKCADACRAIAERGAQPQESGNG